MVALMATTGAAAWTEVVADKNFLHHCHCLCRRHCHPRRYAHRRRRC